MMMDNYTLSFMVCAKLCQMRIQWQQPACSLSLDAVKKQTPYRFGGYRVYIQICGSALKSDLPHYTSAVKPTFTPIQLLQEVFLKHHKPRG